MSERDLLQDCLRRLNSLNVAYMLTGSMASNYWGIPRTTHDLDFVIQLPPPMVPNLLAVFGDDFYLEEMAVRSAYKPPHLFNAIDTRSALKVDFWVLSDAPFEREMFGRRVASTLFGEAGLIASAEDTILHKLYWNTITPSDRQIGDAAGIVAVQGESLDVTYMRRWAGELGVGALLADLLAGKIVPKGT